MSDKAKILLSSMSIIILACVFFYLFNIRIVDFFDVLFIISISFIVLGYYLRNRTKYFIMGNTLFFSFTL